MNELISIIIPIYNVENYLSECLNCIINQTYKNLEIILIDDGSTDKSGSICDKFAERDKRIIVYHTKNRGVSSARNLGLKVAAGQWIGFVDPDDLISCNMYAGLYKIAVKENVDIVVCRYRIIKNRNIVSVETINSIDENVKILDHNLSMYYLLDNVSGYFSVIWNKLYKKELLNNMLFESSIKVGEDTLFNFRLYFSNIVKTAFVEQDLYYYYLRINSAVNSNNYNIGDLNSICNLLLKLAITPNKYNKNRYLIVKKENKKILSLDYGASIKDLIKVLIILLPYELVGVFWKIILKIKFRKLKL